MTKFATIIVALVALTLALPPGIAKHCGGYTSSETLVSQDGYYIVADACGIRCAGAVFVYEESNGLAGLQRADSVVDNTCHGRFTADERVH